MNSSRLLQLASRFIGDTLSRSETNELSQALAANPGFADDLRCQVAMDSLMKIHYGHVGARASWDEVVRRLNAPKTKRRGKVLRLLIPLAAAASLLAAARLFLTPADTAPYRIVRQIGPVSATEEGLTTGPGGFAQAVFRDGTVLALDEGTRLRFADPEPGKPSSWHHDAGRFFLTSSARKEALRIESGEARFDILGTSLEIARGPLPQLSVFEGRVRAEHGAAALLVHAGQTARMIAVAEGQRFVLAAPLPTEAALAWTDKLNLDRNSVLTAARAARPPTGDPAIDFRHALALGGDWSIDSAGDALVIRQKTARPGEHRIQLGQARWDRALLTYKFRIVEVGASGFGAGAIFFDETRRYHSFASKKGLQDYWRDGHRGWMVVRQEFERMPNGRIVLRLWELWPEEAPRKKSSAKDWLGDPSYLFQTPLGIGFIAENCAVEFADIEIKPIR